MDLNFLDKHSTMVALRDEISRLIRIPFGYRPSNEYLELFACNIIGVIKRHGDKQPTPAQLERTDTANQVDDNKEGV